MNLPTLRRRTYIWSMINIIILCAMIVWIFFASRGNESSAFMGVSGLILMITGVVSAWFALIHLFFLVPEEIMDQITKEK